MKIKNIRVKNLASLLGKQEEVIFGDGGLDGGLVAVTGATGSGKSTLIDAVCLALFGTTPRLKGISGDEEGRKVNNLLSIGTSEALAEVDFIDSQERLLRSKWTLTRSKQGNFQAQMSLVDLATGAELGRNMTEVRQEISEATGMKFEQFNGVVVLSQGSFSSFLKGNKDERATLLERLTGTDIYTQLSKAAFEDVKRKEAVVSNLEQSIGAHLPMKEEERTQLENSKRELEVEDTRLQTELEGIRHKHGLLDALHQSHRDEATAKEQLKQVEDLHQAATPDREQGQKAQRAESIRSPLNLVTERRKSFEQAKVEVTTATTSRDTTLKQKEALLERMLAQSADLQARLHETKMEKDRTNRDGVAEPGRCSILGEKFNAHASAVKDLNAIKGKLPDLQAQLIKGEELYKESQTKEAKALLLAEQAKEELQKASGALSEQVKSNGDLPNLVSIEAKLQQASTTLIDFRSTSETLKKEHGELEAGTLTLKELQQKIEQEQRIIEERTLAHQDAIKGHDAIRKVADLVQHRHVLEQDQPCPLCLNTVAELPRDLPTSELEQAAARLEASSERLKEAQAQCQVTSKLETQASARQEALEKSIFKLEQQKEQLLVRLGNLLEESGIESSISEQTEEQISNLRSSIATSKALLEKAQKSVNEANTVLGQLEKDALTAQRALSGHRENIIGLTKEVESLNRQVEDKQLNISEQRQTMDEELASLAEACGCDLPEFHTVPSWLEERVSRYHHHIKVARLVENNASHCEELCSSILAECPAGSLLPDVPTIEFHEDALLTSKQAMERLYEEHRKAKDSVHQANTILSQAMKSREGCEKELQEAEAQLSTKLSQYGLPSLEEASSWLMPPEAFMKLQQKLKALDDHLTSARSVLITTQTRIDKLKEDLGQDCPQSSMDLQEARLSSSDHLSNLEAKQKQVSQDFGVQKTLLEEDDKRRKQHEASQKELEALRSRLLIAKHLSTLIGSSDGSKFRKFAQTLTLEQLVHFANQRLSKFRPRYSLATRSELQLDVIDHEQADEVRPASTLSGGESFLASLALALGLADFRRGTGSIGTVFIDEGFGSLDHDSLESALVTLENVQAELDAQVVVISHVGELQDRWKDHIHVRGLGNGRSWLVVPGGPTNPPKESESIGSIYEPSIDIEAIVTFLEGANNKQTKSNIAKHLGIDKKDKRLDKVLKEDGRFLLDGKSYALVDQMDVASLD